MMTPMDRATYVPFLIGLVLLAVVYYVGVPLHWDNGALGVGCLVACVTAAVVRSQMAGYYRRR
jgi:hypothetical protein